MNFIGTKNQDIKKLESQLAEIPNQTYITEKAKKADVVNLQNQINNIGNASPKGIYGTLSALQTAFPTGTTGIYVVAADGNWYYWSGSTWTVGGIYQSTGIQDESITPKKTTMFEYSENMFNGVVTEGYVISNNDGSLTANVDYRVSEFIEVKPNTKYTVFGWFNIGYYTSAKSFISRPFTANGESTIVTTPGNCYFIRLSTSITHRDQQFVLGEHTLSRNTYVDFYQRVKPEYIYISDEAMISSEILNRPVTKDKSTFYENRTLNLFNGDVVEGYSFSDSDGSIVANSVYRTSDFIEVEPLKKYTPYKWLKVAFYTIDKVFISAYATGFPSNLPFTTPSNCFYIRLATSLTSREQMLLKGEYDTFYYESYKKTISFNDIKLPRWKEKTYFSSERLRGYYKAPVQTFWNPSVRNVNDIYGIYDTLLSANIGYITKTNLGKDQSGLYDIYQYNFKPSYPTSTNNKQHLPKIVLFSGVHGLERWSIYAIAKLMEDICNNHANNEILEYLRFNVEFIVIPLVNPWGYIEATRWNSNGVNINRNFDFNWIVSGNGAFTNDYEGTSPYSEVETKYVKKVMINNLDALAIIDAHTHDVTTWDNVYWHILSTKAESYDAMAGICKYNISVMSRKMKVNYSLGFNGFIGSVDYADTPCLTSYSSSVLGINTVTGEATDKLPSEAQSGTALTNQLNVEFYGNLVCNIIKHFS